MSAYDELIEFLKEDEVVEGVVFGEEWDDEYVSKDKQGILFSLEEAKPFMQKWPFYGGFGAPSCPPTYIWTNKRVILLLNMMEVRC